MNLKDLEIGVPFYRVYALGKGSFMTKITPTSKPYDKVLLSDTETLFIDCVEEMGLNSKESFTHNTSMSLRDAGIVPNTYNSHESFLSEKPAKRFLKLAQQISHSLDNP